MVKMMTGRAKEWAVMAWVRDAQVGYLIGTADSKQVQVPAEGDAHARRDPSQGGPGPSESAHP